MAATAKQKANLIPAKKGEVRNPHGKPVGSKNRATILKKWLEVASTFKNPETGESVAGTVEDKVMLALINKAMKGDVQAAKEIMDTVYGKVITAVDHTSDGKPLAANTTTVVVRPPLEDDE